MCSSDLRDAEEYEHAAIIIILEFLKQLRTNNSCSPDLRKQLNISKKYLDFAESMEEAYNYFLMTNTNNAYIK